LVGILGVASRTEVNDFGKVGSPTISKQFQSNFIKAANTAYNRPCLPWGLVDLGEDIELWGPADGLCLDAWIEVCFFGQVEALAMFVDSLDDRAS
jgi:hypothetical protein